MERLIPELNQDNISLRNEVSSLKEEVAQACGSSGQERAHTTQLIKQIEERDADIQHLQQHLIMLEHMCKKVMFSAQDTEHKLGLFIAKLDGEKSSRYT